MASDKAYNLQRFLACQQPRELKLKQKHEVSRIQNVFDVFALDECRSVNVAKS